MLAPISSDPAKIAYPKLSFPSLTGSFLNTVMSKNTGTVAALAARRGHIPELSPVWAIKIKNPPNPDPARNPSCRDFNTCSFLSPCSEESKRIAGKTREIPIQVFSAQINSPRNRSFLSPPPSDIMDLWNEHKISIINYQHFNFLSCRNKGLQPFSVL